MPISLKMPALSPTMEHGTLAKWLVKEGDTVEPGDIVAEIETDKATMEYECIEEGTVSKILVPEGTEGVKVGTEIALLTGEDEDVADAPAKDSDANDADTAQNDKKEDTSVNAEAQTAKQDSAPEPEDKGYGGREQAAQNNVGATAPAANGGRIKASPLAKRLAAEKSVDLSKLTGSGPHGRIVKADVDAAKGGDTIASDAPAAASEAPAASAKPVEMAAETRAILDDRIPHQVEKLSGMRKTIAKRLTQSMQQAPHIYLTVDVKLDRLLALRSELNSGLTGTGVKLSVNDMLIKALGLALIEVPDCNVAFAGNELIRYSRADVSVAVSIPGGLITPIVQDASGRSLSEISKSMHDLGQRAKKGKLQANEYQGGTASLSNMGMMGIKHFTAVINPPQATIIAVGAGEQRAIVENGEVKIANMMTATGSFDHRAIDGADGARLMAAFKQIVEAPGRMVV